MLHNPIGWSGYLMSEPHLAGPTAKWDNPIQLHKVALLNDILTRNDMLIQATLGFWKMAEFKDSYDAIIITKEAKYKPMKESNNAIQFSRIFLGK